MPYVGADFDPMDPAETKDLSLDFSNSLRCDDSILTVAWALTVITGEDASSATRLSGDPKVSCNIATQRHTAIQDGVKYRTKATATTKRGETLILYSHVRGKGPDDNG